MIMSFEDFYKLAEYGNEHWKGNFTPLEIACNAYDYKSEYDYSIEHNKPTHTMIELCKLLIEDMDSSDYTDTLEESENALTVEDMEKIITDFYFENL